MNYSAKVIGATQPISEDFGKDTEGLIAYCARRSSPRNPSTWGYDYGGLLDYCIRNRHWSVFQMVDVVVEVEAPRDICRQILRHQSCDFQEFSQRYSDGFTFTTREIRGQDSKNRQNSLDIFTEEEKWEFEFDCQAAIEYAKALYDKWGDYHGKEGAKECRRVFLPEGLTMSNMAIKGSARSWFHYLDVREGNGTQLEHIWVANAIRSAVEPVLPTVLKLDQT